MSKSADSTSEAKQWASLALLAIRVAGHSITALSKTLKESLHFILEIFNDSIRIKGKYGCKESRGQRRPITMDQTQSESLQLHSKSSRFAAPLKERNLISYKKHNEWSTIKRSSSF